MLGISNRSSRSVPLDRDRLDRLGEAMNRSHVYPPEIGLVNEPLGGIVGDLLDRDVKDKGGASQGGHQGHDQQEDSDQERAPGAIAGRALERGEDRADVRARKGQNS